MKYSQGGFMLGENIKKIRKRRNLTQDRLSKLADIPYTSITKIETGVIKKPSVQTVAKIAKVLNISLDELVEGA
jgi:transcriptional regulator with XRE-family HTH domain